MGLSSARVIPLMNVAPGTGETVVSVSTDNAAHGSAAFIQSFAPWLRTMFKKFVLLPVTLPLETIAQQLNEVQPTRISGFPSILNQLCFVAAEGRLHIAPKSFLVGSEPLLPEVHQALERMFGAKVYNFYGCSEASTLGFSCTKGPGLHLSDDLVIFEAVDQRGRSVPSGVPSANVYLTNLFNTLLPLIRYELDDSVTLMKSEGRCGCGSSFRKVKDIHGRTDDAFTYEGKIFVHPVAFVMALGHEPAIIEYQVRQTRRGAHILVRAARPFNKGAVATQISSALLALGLAAPKISIELVTKIDRTVTGKLPRFVRLRDGTK